MRSSAVIVGVLGLVLGLFSRVTWSADPPATNPAAIRVDAGRVLHRLSPLLIGTNLEDLNHQTYGGLYSQLIHGESFQEHVDCDFLNLSPADHLQVFVEENEQGKYELWGWTGRGWKHAVARRLLQIAPGRGDVPIASDELPRPMRDALIARASGEQVSREWRPVRSGSAVASFRFERAKPWVGRQSQKISFTGGEGEVGLDNAGLNRWGINLVANQPYQGLLRIRAEADCEVIISLRSEDGKRTLAEKVLAVSAGAEYQRVAFTLTPSASDEKGRFAITLRKPGSITVGYAFLQPGEWGRYKGLPVRKDLAQAIIDQGIKVIRYDGSMVNLCPDGKLYKWKQMIGPRDQRQPYEGRFNPYASHGFAVFDVLEFCEAAGIVAVPGVRIDETPQDVADFVEYVNGAADTTWGKKRAENGHPAPYNLKYLEIGNEEKLDEAYCARFELLADAIWKKDPSITLLIAHNLAAPAWQADGAQGPAVNLAARLIRFAHERGRSVMWDCHYTARFINDPVAPNGRINSMRRLKEAMDARVPSSDLKLAPLEENGNASDVQRALIHARNQHALYRLGPSVAMAAVANTLQAYQQQIVWPQGKTLFTSSKCWYQPPYYVDQMISRNWAEDLVACEAGKVDAVARLSADKKVLVLQVVNTSDAPVEAEISLNGFTPVKAEATATTLTGEMTAENTLENPQLIVPVTSAWKHGGGAAPGRYSFPARSFTIVRFE